MKEDNYNYQPTYKSTYYSGPKWDNSWKRKPSKGFGNRGYTSYGSYGGFYSSGGPPNKLGRLLRQKILYQILVSVLIFLVAVATHNGQDPIRKTVASSFNYLLTTEINYEPILGKIVKIALSNEVLDWPVLFNQPEPEVRPVQGKVLALPVSGKLIKQYGWQEDPVDNYPRFHEGIDIKAKQGSTVQVVLDGKVTKVGQDPVLGNYVQVHHLDELSTLYAHLSKVVVKADQLIKEGDELGQVGDSGVAEEPHLHFEVRESGQLVDPVTRLKLPKKAGI